MPEERLISISSSSHLAPDEVARHSFGSVRRGYDASEVRAYLESIAIGLRGLAEREQQLLDGLADAEHRAAHPVLDEATLSAAVGSETARVLHSAHEAAAEVLAKSEAEANRLLSEAREEIEQSRAEADGRLAQLTTESETAANELRERTAEQAAAQLDAARDDAEQMLAKARDQCRSMVEEAQGLRTRVLADLSKRRKVLHAQIEQLRAGRERLAETVKDVRRSVDEIAADLFAAEDNARLAAEAAGREALERSDEGSPEELAALLLADEAEAATASAADPVGLGVDGVRETTDEVALAEPADGPPAEPPEERGSGSGKGPGSSPVEALFAKLRASTEGQLVDEREEAEPGLVETPPRGVPVTEAVVATEEVAATETVDVTEVADVIEVVEFTEADPGPADRVDLAAAAEPEADVQAGGVAQNPQGDGADGSVDGEDDGPPVDRNPLAVRRDELIAPIVKALSRRLKRTLQDEQNELLDGLRSNGSKWSADVLPDLTEQADSYTTATLPFLEEAGEAGVIFAGTKKTAKPGGDELIGIAHGLADAVIGPLRRRLSDDQGLSDADESVVAEHVGSAFREWKGERVERLAGDHVVAAFSAGTIAATKGKKSMALEWVSDSSSGEAPCPDCEDNGLNGSLQPDEEFPTGHRHPPAHPGCRCLLAVSAP
jgi:DivIVA domain-containing protein